MCWNANFRPESLFFSFSCRKCWRSVWKVFFAFLQHWKYVVLVFLLCYFTLLNLSYMPSEYQLFSVNILSRYLSSDAKNSTSVYCIIFIEITNYPQCLSSLGSLLHLRTTHCLNFLGCYSWGRSLRYLFGCYRGHEPTNCNVALGRPAWISSVFSRNVFRLLSHLTLYLKGPGRVTG